MECFSIDIKEITGRVDPVFYFSTYRENERTIKRSKWPVKTLADISNKIVDGPFGSQLKVEEYVEEGIPLIRVKDIKDGQLDETGLAYITNAKHEKLKRSKVFSGDIVLTKAGSIGNAAILPSHIKEANITSHLAKIEPRRGINPKYLCGYLNTSYAKLQITRLGSKTTRPELNVSEVSSILIVIPADDIQNQIVDIMESAYEMKRQKEAEAQKLLDSIDDYVLDELGIRIDYKPRLTFATYSNQVQERLDPLYHSQDVYYFLNGYQGSTINLGTCIEYAQSGFAAGFNIQATDGNGILQIRPTNINDDRRLIFDRNIYVKQEMVEKQQGDLLIKNEVLFNNTNSQELVGKSVVFNLEGDYFCSNHITRIKVKGDDLLAGYLTAILNLYQRRGVFYRICTNWNNQSGVNVELLRRVKIPYLPLGIQRKISSEIQSRMNRADELKQQAKAEVEKAKAEVERLILGK
jgi:restriction endonuclease S subunit